MGYIHARAADVLNACPEDIYATLADYQQGHPRILPAENLYDLHVEQGGYGEGTIIQFKARILGVERTFRHHVSEPEPGRVLVEQDETVATRFTVTPLEEGQKARVEIETTIQASPGLQGLLERLFVPPANASVYRKELKLLETVASERGRLANQDGATEIGKK